MDAESLRRTLATGRTWFWSRSRQEYWCKGETSGDRQYVREVRLDCDGDALVVLVDQHGDGRVPHRATGRCFSRTLGPGPGVPAPGGPRTRAVSDAPRAVAPGSGRPPTPRPVDPRPDRSTSPRLASRPRRSCRCGPRWSPTPSPRWRPSCRSSATGPASCSSRWRAASAGAATRSSGRAPLATLVARGRGGDARPGRLAVPTGDGRGCWPPSRRCCRLPLAGPRRPAPAPRGGGRLPRLRRRPRGRAPARRPPRRPRASPTPPWSSSASWPRSTTGASGWCWSTTSWSTTTGTPAESHAAYEAAGERLGRSAADCFRAAGRRARCPCPSAASRRPTSQRTMSAAARTGQAVEVAKEYIRAGDIFQVVLSQRFDLDLERRPLRGLPGAAPAQPEPVPLLPALPRGDGGRVLARADGAPARRGGDLAAHRRLAAAGRHRRARTGCWPASWSRTPRRWPSTSCWSTWPATTSAGWCGSAPRRSTSS